MKTNTAQDCVAIQRAPSTSSNSSSRLVATVSVLAVVTGLAACGDTAQLDLDQAFNTETSEQASVVKSIEQSRSQCLNDSGSRPLTIERNLITGSGPVQDWEGNFTGISQSQNNFFAVPPPAWGKKMTIGRVAIDTGSELEPGPYCLRIFVTPGPGPKQFFTAIFFANDKPIVAKVSDDTSNSIRKGIRVEIPPGISSFSVQVQGGWEATRTVGSRVWFGKLSLEQF